MDPTVAYQSSPENYQQHQPDYYQAQLQYLEGGYAEPSTKSQKAYSSTEGANQTKAGSGAGYPTTAPEVRSSPSQATVGQI